MSTEALKNPGTEEPLDLSSAVSDFIVQKARTAEELRLKTEEEAIRRDEEARRKATILEAGNNRGREIVEESGIREMLEQARVGLSQFYPSATVAEREHIMTDIRGHGTDKRSYLVRLAWRKDSDPSPVKDIWDTSTISPSDSRKGFDYIDINGQGWKHDYMDDVEGQLVIHRGIDFDSLDYDPKDHHRVRGFYHNEWQTRPEEIKKAILEAIGKPRSVSVRSRGDPSIDRISSSSSKFEGHG